MLFLMQIYKEEIFEKITVNWNKISDIYNPSQKNSRLIFNFEYCRTFMETLQTDFVQFSNTPGNIFFAKEIAH